MRFFAHFLFVCARNSLFTAPNCLSDRNQYSFYLSVFCLLFFLYLFSSQWIIPTKLFEFFRMCLEFVVIAEGVVLLKNACVFVICIGRILDRPAVRGGSLLPGGNVCRVLRVPCGWHLFFHRQNILQYGGYR